jgi:Carboxypeptidase regulatory-like domain
MTVSRVLIVLLGVLMLAGCNHMNDPVQPGQPVQGFVYDAATQAAIADVRIEIAGRTAVSNANGYYAVADIPRGAQMLTATKPGYAPYVTDVQVASGANEKRFYLQRM